MMRWVCVGALASAGIVFGCTTDEEAAPTPSSGGSDAAVDGAQAGGGDATVSEAGGTTSDGATNDAAVPDAAIADAGPDARPHPLYPALDLSTLPGDGGAASGPYEPPALPATTRTVTIATTGGQARADIATACAVPGTAVTVPNAAGAIGALDLGNVNDCDVTFGAAVVVDFVFLGHLPGPVVAPVHRVRLRGGQIGSVYVDPGSSDIVLDGVVINSGLKTAAQRSSTGIYLIDSSTAHVNRFACVNSIVRMVATAPTGAGDTDGNAYLGAKARNVLFANNNIVTAGNRSAWGFRIGGGENYVIVDNTVRVSFHKLIRMNDAPVDYVYVKGGTWMREAVVPPSAVVINDSFAQLGDLGTDRIYIHDPAVHMLSTSQVTFGATGGPGQVGKRWEARRIKWFARSAAVVSDAILSGYQGGCAAGAICDYGLGTHSYAYDANLAFPVSPWRVLPTIANGDPDTLPTTP